MFCEDAREVHRRHLQAIEQAGVKLAIPLHTRCKRFTCLLESFLLERGSMQCYGKSMTQCDSGMVVNWLGNKNQAVADLLLKWIDHKRSTLSAEDHILNGGQGRDLDGGHFLLCLEKVVSPGRIPWIDQGCVEKPRHGHVRPYCSSDFLESHEWSSGKCGTVQWRGRGMINNR